MLKCDFLIVGAGFSGCVLAERIASQLKKNVIIIDKRGKIGGNSIDEYDSNSILIHKYGPHLFHTNDKKIYDYLSKFTEWRLYEHKVLACHKNEFYEIPINLNTINKFFNNNFIDEKQVKEFLNTIRSPKKSIENSEDVVVDKIGYELFDAFFKYYTKKQWNAEPKDLNAGVCGRIPIRYNVDNRYFGDKYQVIPKDGYFNLFTNMVKNNHIKIVLNNSFKDILQNIKHKYLIYTGPIDEYFNFKFGKLPYRSIDFKFENLKTVNHQSVAQVNYVDPDVKYTRVVEYKHITGQKSPTTSISLEYPQKIGEPYYPIPNLNNDKLYRKYYYESLRLKNVIFCGRLAEYKYYNMDQVVGRALHIFDKVFKDLKN